MNNNLDQEKSHIRIYPEIYIGSNKDQDILKYNHNDYNDYNEINITPAIENIFLEMLSSKYDHKFP